MVHVPKRPGEPDCTFADTRIAAEYDGPVLYAKDAMHGLELANQLADPKLRPGLFAELAERQEGSARLVAARRGRRVSDILGRRETGEAKEAVANG